MNKNKYNIKITRHAKLFFVFLHLIFITNFKSVAQQPYNVVLITLDDMNDWVGFLDGNHQSITPNMDKLASEGFNFTNAHCPSAVCNPSRASFLTGFMPTTSLIYTNTDTLRKSPVLQKAFTMPQYFKVRGYYTMSTGKIFHHRDYASWSLNTPDYGGWPTPAADSGLTPNGIPINLVTKYFWWGAMPDSMLQTTPDYLSAQWAQSRLNLTYTKPFFLACGFTRPHLPWYVPEMFFNKFPLDSIILPNVDTNDLNDVPGNVLPNADYIAARDYGLLKETVRGYLASIAYADSCVGVILDALNNSAFANNTIVILLSDHGFQMSEKLRYGKLTLWNESTRVPLIIKIPGYANAGSSISAPVNLYDIYPTITELCGLPDNTNNEGASLKPLLLNPNFVAPRVSLTSNNSTGVLALRGSSIRTSDWRFTVHLDNSKELYNQLADSMEIVNLASNLLYDSVSNNLEAQFNNACFKISNQKLPIRKNIIPGVIQAEKYDTGGEGIGYHDEDTINHGLYYRTKDGVDIAPCIDAYGGLQVDSIANGEWLSYTINQIFTGRYTIKFRGMVDDTVTKKVHVFLGGTKITEINIGGNINVWKNYYADTFNLTKKSNTELKLVFEGAAFRLNHFEFVKVPSVAKMQEIKPEEINTFEIYPNPVYAESFINITVPQKGMVDLYITNVLGERICTLVNEEVLEGEQSISFCPATYNLLPGFYFCKFDFNSKYSATKKFVVVE